MKTLSLKPKKKIVKCNFSKNHPELMELLTELGKFSMDNQPSKIATKAGISDETLRVRMRRNS